MIVDGENEGADVYTYDNLQIQIADMIKHLYKAELANIKNSTQYQYQQFWKASYQYQYQYQQFGRPLININTNINTGKKVNINSLINTNIVFYKGNEAVCD